MYNLECRSTELNRTVGLGRASPHPHTLTYTHTLKLTHKHKIEMPQRTDPVPTKLKLTPLYSHDRRAAFEGIHPSMLQIHRLHFADTHDLILPQKLLLYITFKAHPNPTK